MQRFPAKTKSSKYATATTPNKASAERDFDNEYRHHASVSEIENDEYNQTIAKRNSTITNLTPPQHPYKENLNEYSSTNTSTNRSNTSSNYMYKRPPHCRKCNHPTRGHTQTTIQE